MRTRNPSERGFTLVEVVASMTVLALVVGPLSAAAVLFVRHGSEASAYLADSGTVRVATALFVADAQSADSVAVPDVDACGSADVALLTTTSDDRGTVYRSSWFATPVSGVPSLVRRRCTGTSLLSTVVLGDLASTPSVSCAPTCASPSSLTMSGTTISGVPFTATAQRRPS